MWKRVVSWKTPRFVDGRCHQDDEMSKDQMMISLKSEDPEERTALESSH